MAKSVETAPIDHIRYAGQNPLRMDFLAYVVDGTMGVSAAGGGIEPQAINPLRVAQQKLVYVRGQEMPGEQNHCFIAFDTLTAVPNFSSDGLIQYEIKGKPFYPFQLQQMFWGMGAVAEVVGKTLPYRITSASVLQCNGSTTQASHAAEVTLSQPRLRWLMTDRGMDMYTQCVEAFGYSSGTPARPTNVAAGLHLESLLALGCVEAIDGVTIDDRKFLPASERAIFLATVGASHRVLGPLTHDPMGHIVQFPHHRDRVALVNKHMGVL